MLDKKAIESLELVEDGVPICRLCFGISWYIEKPISALAKEIRTAYDRFWSLVGADGMTQYQVETSTKHRKLNKKAMSIVPTWFSPEAPPTYSYGIEFNDADPPEAAPTKRLELLGREAYKGERVKTPTLVRFALPASFGVERRDEMLALVQELSDVLPFRSGHAGYVFEPSHYNVVTATEHAWAKSMRHPGIDIHGQGVDVNAVEFDGVRGVGWLTMLDDAHVEALKKLPKFEHCKVIKLKRGVIIQAGESPEIGDVNRGDKLPAYREAFAAIEPLTRETFERSPWVKLDHDEEERTQRWYKRLSDG